MTEAVKGDVLINLCFLYPSLQWNLYHASLESFEDLAHAIAAAELQCLIADWKSRFCSCLDSLDANPVTSIGSQFNLIPCQVENVTDAKSGKT